MFNKIPSEKPDMLMKNSPADARDKNKEMFDRISRIQDSYVDAAIRAVKRKSAGRKNPEM